MPAAKPATQSADADFCQVNVAADGADLLATLLLEADDHLSQWQVLGKRQHDAAGFGGFAGYNSQWQNLILGVEATTPIRPSVLATDSRDTHGPAHADASGRYSVVLTGLERRRSR